jgi:uncharacterized protein YaiI (UPF0178 family)
MKDFKIIVDGDACPFKNDIINLADKYDKELYIVFSTSHVSNYPEQVKTVMVDNQKEAADLAVVNLAKAEDIVITQDYGLAAMVLAKKARVLLNRGLVADGQNINQLLAFRHISAKNRKNRVRMKGPSKLTEEDRKNFLTQLQKMITE